MNSDNGATLFTNITYESRDWSLCGDPEDYLFGLVNETKQFYELDLLETVRELIAGREGLVLDVGANLGNHTLYFAGVMGRDVVSIEPAAENFEFLQRNVAANGLSDRVVALQIAAWDYEATLTFEQKIASNRGTIQVREDEGGGIRGQALDEVLESDRRVAAVKIDVEGAELRVLDGLQRTIQDYRPIVTVESHGAAAAEGFAAWFEDRGYLCVDVKGRSDNLVWVPASSDLPSEVSAIVSRSARNTRSFARSLGEVSERVRRIDASVKALAAESPEILESVKQVGKSLEESGRTNHQDSMAEQISLLVASLVSQRESASSSISNGAAHRIETFLETLRNETMGLSEKLSTLEIVGERLYGRSELQECTAARALTKLERIEDSRLSGVDDIQAVLDMVRIGQEAAESREVTFQESLDGGFEARREYESRIESLAERLAATQDGTSSTVTEVLSLVSSQSLDVEAVRETLMELSAQLGAWLGYPSEDVDSRLTGIVESSGKIERVTGDALDIIREVDGTVKEISQESAKTGSTVSELLSLVRGIEGVVEEIAKESVKDDSTTTLLLDLVRALAADVTAVRVRQERDPSNLTALIGERGKAQQDGLARLESKVDALSARLVTAGTGDLGVAAPLPVEPEQNVQLKDVLRLARAYVQLSKRFSSIAPAQWSTSAALEGLSSRISSDAIRAILEQANAGSDFVEPVDDDKQLDSKMSVSDQMDSKSWSVAAHGSDRRYDRVRVGIASMPGREHGLAEVVNIIAPQADEVLVYLNGMDRVPDILPTFGNVWYFTGPDLGDRGKFAFIEGFHGYYLTVDDDIAYSKFHVDSIIDGIERYKRKAVVGWHGSIFKKDFEKFYDAKSRQVLSFRFLRGKDTPVHLLGTGVCGFHTDTLDIRLSDFIYPNMADAFVAVAAKQQAVPMIVLRHEKDWATPIEVGPSISSVSLGKEKDSGGAGFDVATTVTNLVKQNGPWLPLEADTDKVDQLTRQTFTVGLIGRTDKERWKKGGILKSSHLTVKALDRFGVTTLLEDIETGDPSGFKGVVPEIVLIYVGDPERPDFSEVEKLVDKHADKGSTVVINLSINGKTSRNRAIVQKMLAWERRFDKRVRLMVFTEAAFSIAELAEVKHLMVVIPKTIELPDPPVANFHNSSGIFLGDIAKMNDDSLLGIPAEEWIAAIRRALPGVRLYALRQYKPKVDKGLDIDEVWPFLKQGEFGERISQCRLMISLVKFATFEMVPLEVASLGLPVIYPEMPQSLSEYLGLSGYAVRNPGELERVLPAIYQDPLVWRSMSQSSIERAWSSELGRLSGQMYLRLLSLVKEQDR